MKKKVVYVIVLVLFIVSLIAISKYLSNIEEEQMQENLDSMNLEEEQTQENLNSMNLEEEQTQENLNDMNLTEERTQEYLNNVNSEENTNIEESISTTILSINESEFEEEVLKSSKIVLVDFYAEWCTPCKRLYPILEEIARNNTNENLKFVRINIDNANKIANRYGIYSIPTLLIFKNGEKVDSHLGYAEKQKIENFINANL